MLEILLPSHCQHEITWVCTVMLREFLGLEFRTRETASTCFSIRFEGRSLEFPDVFFAKAAKFWLEPVSLPVVPLQVWDVATSGLKAPLLDECLPVLFGKPEIEFSENCITLGLDLFGSAFFMLSRYEEAVRDDRDNHDRFPADASVASQAGFLDRPIVNEYLEILWACMKKLWPSLERKERRARTLVSCDVDAPYSLSTTSLQMAVKTAGGDLLKRKSLRTAIRSLINYQATLLGNYRYDPLNTFEWIMDMNEAEGNQVTFFFIVDKSVVSMDGYYSIDEPRVRRLMRRIHERGHHIGLHCSYGTYKDSTQTLKEAELLRQVLEFEKIPQEEIGCRQHVLRWSPLHTASNLDNAGLAYDSTLAFAERAGFRCGTCYEYSLYDVVERRPLNVRERPLILMECSVIAERYMGLGYTEEALALMLSYKQKSHFFNGDFMLLWHNSHLLKPADRLFYSHLISRQQS